MSVRSTSSGFKCFWVLLGLLALGLPTTGVTALAPPPLTPAPQYLLAGETRRFAITYIAKVPKLPRSAHSIQLWLPVPQDTPLQEIQQLTFSQPVQLAREPKYGNRIAYCELTNASSAAELKMTFVCTRREARLDLSRLAQAEPEDPAALVAFLQPERLVTITDRITRIASGVAGGKTNTLQRARALYDYVVGTMRYDKTQPGWGTGSSEFACTARAGNCTDFHAFFNALCRSQGIASGFEIGLYLPYARGAQEPPGSYHCWAWFRVPGRTWVPVDCSEANRWPARKDYFFGNLTCNRVAFSTGRDLTLVPKQSGPPLNYFLDPYAEAEGQPVPAEKSWAFEELD